MRKILLYSGIGIGSFWATAFGTASLPDCLFAAVRRTFGFSTQAEVNRHDRNGFTPMHRILNAYNENRDAERNTWQQRKAVKELIGEGADLTSVITQGPKQGMTSLALAVSTNDNNKRMVKLLLEAHADINQRVNLNRMNLTPLALAIYKKHTFIALLLLEHKADVNALAHVNTHNGTDVGTVLHMLARSGGETEDENGFIHELLEAGADYTCEDRHKRTPLALYNHYFSPESLVKKPYGFAHALGLYWNSLYRECFTLLTQQCAVPDVLVIVITDYLKGDVITDRDTITPEYLHDENQGLEEAIQRGNRKAIKKRMRHEHSVLSRPDKQGYMPLHRAVQNNNRAVITMLLHAGATINLPCLDGSTPLHLAVSNGNITVVATLLSAGAHQEAVDKNKMRPLHLAAEKGHAAIVEALLNARAHRDAQNKDGSTPLHLAGKEGHKKVVELLLNARANQDLINKAYKNPRELAQEEGHEDVAKMLHSVIPYPDEYYRYIWPLGSLTPF